MREDNQWLRRVLSINEDTPYRGNLVGKSEVPDGESTFAGQALTVDGITVFRLEDGCLTFRFFIDDNRHRSAAFEAFAASNLMLHVPQSGFVYPVAIMGLSGDTTTLRGIIDTEDFGEKDTPLSGVTIWLAGLPEKWYAAENWSYFEAISNEEIQTNENGELVFSNRNSRSLRALSGLTLKSHEWKATLREIPNSHRSGPGIAHVCNLTNETNSLTGEVAWKFIEENMFPFLNFVFGQKTRFRNIMGYKDGVAMWARTATQNETPLKTEQGNWFLRTWDDRTDLSPLFQRFYDLEPEVKNHWRKVIHRYATSEEIMGTLRDSALAASVSFSALEGLTRSIISTYPCKDDWLNEYLRLKRGKGIIDAVGKTAELEFGPHSKTFREASERIYLIRNATVHTDLMTDEDPLDAYYRWNASQTLVEIFLLHKMGLDKIPNRTDLGMFNVMGKDMYQDMRKEWLDFSLTNDDSDLNE